MAVDPFLTHEAMDRTHVAAEYFEEHVLSHAFMKGNKEVLRKATAIRDKMQELYQVLGSQALRDRSAFQPAETTIIEESVNSDKEPPISSGISEEEFKTLCEKLKIARAYGSPAAFALDDSHAATLAAKGTPADMIILSYRVSYTEALASLNRMLAKEPSNDRVRRLCRL